MKRFFLAILFLSSFGFVSTVFAYNPVVFWELPYITQGYTFDKLACASIVSGSNLSNTCVYVANDTSLQLRNNYLDYLEWKVVPNTSYYHYIVCQSDNGVMRDEQCSTVVSGYGSASSAMQSLNNALYSVDILDAYPPYDTEVLYFANYPLPNLSVSRSPELGGGVVITLPDTFEYQCGTEGQEECEFDDLPYNSQVTLEESHNEGYAFSHWEINNQTMGDVDGEIPVTMSENKVVKAVFKPVLNFPLSGTLENRELTHFFFGDTWNCAQCGQCPTGTYKLHTGADLNATYDYQNEVGERVDAAHSGTVKKIYTGQHSIWADAIVIESSDGQFTTVYWHVIKYGSLAENDPVTKGQQIATIADLSDNTHFHFGIRMAPYSDPESYAGALPVADGCGYLAFPENFISPKTAIYE